MRNIDFLALGLRHLSWDGQEQLRLYLDQNVSWGYASGIRVYVDEDHYLLKDWIPEYTSLVFNFDGPPMWEEIFKTIKCIGIEYMGRSPCTDENKSVICAIMEHENTL